MNMQPVLQSKSSSNGFPLRRGEREGASNKAQSIKSHSPNTAFNGEAGSLERLSRDRLVYLTTCKIGHMVEVHLKNGSVYSGIFHAADVEKDFGIILKMACLIKDGTLRGHKSRSEFFRKPPSKTFIIPSDELVQVVAKDLSVSTDSMLNAVQSEKPMELLTDSSISQSYHVDRGRELKPWVPDENVPQGADLENVFDHSWNRGWNQFEVNESLFGVKSTFNEELYTTKLERGPRTRELEEQALRIAREIEGENTRDLHVAEERGLQLNEKFDIDEETKYSSVRPATGFDDSGFAEEDDALLDTCNDLTFGSLSPSDGQKPASSGKGCEELWGDSQSSRNITNVDQSCSISDDHARHLPSEQRSKDFPAPGSSISSESLLDERRTNNNQEVSHNNRSAEESISGRGDINEGAKRGGGATSASKDVAERERQVSQVSDKTKSESSSAQSASRSSESRPGPTTSSRPGVSPSSSIGSMSSSEKSTLNPNAKEFKLNPNAKSFKPSQPVAVRPHSPVSDASFYYPGPVLIQHVQQMPGMPPVNYGVQQYPGHQPPMMYHHPQAFYPPNGQPQYPQQQQMMPGQQPRPVYYMQAPPPYQPVIHDQKEEFTHFISLPLAIYPELKEKVQAFKNSILDHKNPLKFQRTLAEMGIEKSIFVSPNTFHLTVVMLKSGDKESVDAAQKIIKSISSNVRKALKNRPVFIRLRGLDRMSTGPLDKTRVLYVPVEEVGDEGRLLSACHVIIDAFEKAGFAGKDAKSRLKLHGTVMNVSHRKDKSKKMDTFDAREIHKNFEKKDWGTYLITEAHLSQRYKYDPSGYYHCCASLPFPPK